MDFFYTSDRSLQILLWSSQAERLPYLLSTRKGGHSWRLGDGVRRFRGKRGAVFDAIEFDEGAGPGFAVLRLFEIRLLREVSEDVLAEVGRDVPGAAAAEFIEVFHVGAVGEVVFAGDGLAAGVNVEVGEIHAACADAADGVAVGGDGVVDTFEVEVLGFGSGNFEIEALERAEFGDEFDDKGDDAGAEGGFTVVLTPFLFVFGTGKVVEEEALCGAVLFLDVVGRMKLEGDFSELGHEQADGVAEGFDGEVRGAEDVVERDAVGFLEGALEKGRGDFEADEVMVLFGGIAVFGDLGDVETELDADMRLGAFGVGDFLAVFFAKLRKGDRDGAIDIGRPALSAV